MKKLLTYYTSHLNLHQVQLLTETPRAFVYKARQKGRKVVLKIFKGSGILEERRGTEFLKICQGHGVVEVLQADDQALLMAYSDGPTLENYVREGKDQEAAVIITEVLSHIHACPIPKDHPLITLEERLNPLFTEIENPHLIEAEEVPLFAKAQDLAKTLLQDQRDISLLHGDIHHENIIFDSQKGWLAIDPKGLVGDRAYDVANVFLNPWDAPDLVQDQKRIMEQAHILATQMKLDRKKLLKYAFVHACLSQLWFMSDGERSEHDSIMIKLLSRLVH